MEAKTDFKSLSTKSKFQYIWDYYRWHIIVGIVVIWFVGSMVHHYATYREPFLNVIMINTIDSSSTDAGGFAEFQELYGYDDTKYPILLTSNLYFPEGEQLATTYMDVQTLMTLISSGDQDLFFGTGDVYLNYCDQGALADLSDFLSPELLAKYEDQLIYSTAGGEVASYPCAIELTDNTWLSKYNYYDSCYFGILQSAPHTDAAKQFAEFLLTYE